MSRNSGEREPLLGNQSRENSNYTGAVGHSTSVVTSEEEEDESMAFKVMIKRAVRKQVKGCCSKENLKTKLPIMNWLPKYRYQMNKVLDMIDIKWGILYFLIFFFDFFFLVEYYFP